MEPRDLAALAETAPAPAPGDDERFQGWGVMGLPFASGHVLALRRFPSSSLGPAYTSVWHRRPDGRWSFHADVEPRLACTRYFGREAAEAAVHPIELAWTGPRSFRVALPAAGLEWRVRLGATPVTRALNAAGRLIPERLWWSRPALAVMGRLAGVILRAGRLSFHGRVPNGQAFLASPRVVWVVEESAATLAGEDLGAPAPLDRQARLGDFRIPQRGLAAFAQARFERFDPGRHSTVTSGRAGA